MAKKWWFIVGEETAPHRGEPLPVHVITKHDPVTYLVKYEQMLNGDSGGKCFSLRAFWLMDRTPTKTELESYCQDSVIP